MADKHFGFYFFVFKISDFSLFFMQQLQSIPLPTSPPFFSIPQEKGGAHYVSRSLLKKMFNVFLRSHLTLFSTSGHIKSHE